MSQHLARNWCAINNNFFFFFYVMTPACRKTIRSILSFIFKSRKKSGKFFCVYMYVCKVSLCVLAMLNNDGSQVYNPTRNTKGYGDVLSAVATSMSIFIRRFSGEKKKKKSYISNNFGILKKRSIIFFLSYPIARNFSLWIGDVLFVTQRLRRWQLWFLSLV